MSIGLDAIEIGFDTMKDFHGEALVLVRGGRGFVGLIDPQPEVDPTLEISSDYREIGMLHVKQSDDPGLVANDTITQAPDKWRVVRRDNNPADFVVKYWLVKIVAGVDS